MESNHRPPPYQGGALPTELRERNLFHEKNRFEKIAHPASTSTLRRENVLAAKNAAFAATALRALHRSFPGPLQSSGSMERETGIEPALVAWKATVLPLNYSRSAVFRPKESRLEFSGLQVLHRLSRKRGIRWWREVDSNHRRHEPADLQSAPVGRLGIPPELDETTVKDAFRPVTNRQLPLGQASDERSRLFSGAEAPLVKDGISCQEPWLPASEARCAASR